MTCPAQNTISDLIVGAIRNPIVFEFWPKLGPLNATLTSAAFAVSPPGTGLTLGAATSLNDEAYVQVAAISVGAYQLVCTASDTAGNRYVEASNVFKVLPAPPT